LVLTILSSLAFLKDQYVYQKYFYKKSESTKTPTTVKWEKVSLPCLRLPPNNNNATTDIIIQEYLQQNLETRGLPPPLKRQKTKTTDALLHISTLIPLISAYSNKLQMKFKYFYSPGFLCVSSRRWLIRKRPKCTLSLVQIPPTWLYQPSLRIFFLVNV